MREGRTASTLPESYGSDFLWVCQAGKVGVQRKEINDLLSSLKDGRLAKELGQMTALDIGILIIEGRLQWSTDGYLLNARSFTKAQLHGVLFSVQSQGLWYLPTESLSDTAELLTHLETWLSKDRHGLIRTRPKASGSWGKASSREWSIHFLQSFPGIGSDTAGRIYDHFGGLPISWTCEMADLVEVKGVGMTRALKMIEALEKED